MKKGCAVLLLVWTLSAVGYWWLLEDTATDWPLLWAIVLGLALMVLFGAVFALLLSLGRARSLRRKPNEWRNQEFVGASGWLSPCGETLTAPLSGQPALLFLVEVKRVSTRTHKTGSGTRSESSSRGVVLAMGMAACEVRGAWSSTRLVGYPLLAESKPEAATDDASRERLAAWLLQHPPQAFEGRPMARWKRLQAVYADPDGQLLEVFGQEDDDFDKAFATAREMAADHRRDVVGVAHLAHWLKQNNCQLLEKRIAPNAEVCAFGQWDAATRRLDVGSGMQNLGRDVLVGSARSVGARVVRRSVLSLAVILGVAAALNLLVWEFAGRPTWPRERTLSPLPAEAPESETPRLP